MTARGIRPPVAGVVLVAAVACGAAGPPGEAAPGLRTRLTQVDTALAGGHYGTARTALDALVREAVAARDDGRITDDQAGRILAAAARLAAHLPAEGPARPTPGSTTPTPRPTTARPPAPPAPEPTKDEDKKDDEKKDEGDGNKKDEDKKDEKEGSGPDPDDGHGN